MSPFRIPEPPYTIEGVMEDLHQEFVGSGVHGPASLGWPTRCRRRDRGVAGGGRAGVAVEPDYRIRSHRPLLRYLIDPLKRLIHWGGQPYVRLLIEKQEQFNANVLALLRVQLARQRTVDDARARLHAEMKRAHGVFQEALERADAFIGEPKSTRPLSRASRRSKPR